MHLEVHEAESSVINGSGNTRQAGAGIAVFRPYFNDDRRLVFSFRRSRPRVFVHAPLDSSPLAGSDQPALSPFDR
jgi:hypothetical protein